MGKLFPFRLKGEEARVGTRTIRCWRHWHDRTQVPTLPFVSKAVFRHSLSDSCASLRHATQNLIDKDFVDLGHPGFTTDPLPTHDNRAIPPPPGGIDSIEFLGDEIFMIG